MILVMISKVFSGVKKAGISVLRSGAFPWKALSNEVLASFKRTRISLSNRVKEFK